MDRRVLVVEDEGEIAELVALHLRDLAPPPRGDPNRSWPTLLDCPSDSVYVLYMSQLNIHTTRDFDDALDRFRRLRKLPSKSEAVRVAVREALDREERGNMVIDYRDWLGLGLAAPANKTPKFASHDDLWRELGGR